MSVRAEDWTDYRDPAAMIALRHPQRWSATPGLMGTVVAVIEPEDQWTGGFAANVNVVLAPSQNRTDDYAREQVKMLAETMNEFELVDVVEQDRPQAKTVRIIGSYLERGRKLTVDQLHILTPAQSAVVSATAPSERFDDLRATLERILASVELGAEGASSGTDPRRG